MASPGAAASLGANKAIIIDTTSPTIAITSPTAASYINSSSNTTTFTVSGTCSENGQTVTVKVNGSAATSQVGGSCNGTTFTSTIDVTGLSEASHALTAIIVDAAGNSTTSASVSVTKDITNSQIPSAIALQSPTTSPNTDSTPTLRVSGVVSGYTVTIYSDSDCAIVSAKGTGVATGTTIDLTSDTMSESTQTFYADTTDAASNRSSCSSVNVSYKYDGTAPVSLAFSTPAANSYVINSNQTAYALTGTCGTVATSSSTSADSTTITFGGSATSTTTTCTAGSWSKSVDVSGASDGSISVSITQDDEAGNSSTISLSLNKDTTSPSAPSSFVLSSPSSSSVSTDTTPEITGTGAEVGSTITIYTNDNTCAVSSSGTATAAADGSFTVSSFTLSTDALKTFYYTIADTRGNTSSCTTTGLSYTLDTTLPTAPGAITLGSVPSDLTSTPTFTFTASTDTNGIASYQAKIYKTSDSATIPQDWTTITSGSNLSSLTSNLVDSTGYTVAIRATDTAGNVGTSYSTNTWTASSGGGADTTAPTAPTNVTLDDTLIGDFTPIISWTASTDAVGVDHYEVQIYLSSDDSVAQSWTTLTSGNTIAVALSTSSSYYVKVRALDAAGNISSSSSASATWTPIARSIYARAPSFTDVSLGEVLSVGYITLNNTYLCPAVIIDTTHAITPATCTHGNNASDLKLIVGRVDTTDSSGQSLTVDSFSEHASYDSSTYVNNISVLYVGGSGSINYGGTVGAATMPSQDETTTTGNTLVAYTWNAGANGTAARTILGKFNSISVESVSGFSASDKTFFTAMFASNFASAGYFGAYDTSISIGGYRTAVFETDVSGNPTKFRGFSLYSSYGTTHPDVGTDISHWITWISNQP